MKDPDSPSVPWLAEVARVNVSRDARGGPYQLASGGLSSIVLGRVVFRDGTRKRVAIKLLRSAMDDTTAHRTQACIERLRAQGVSLPKMFVYGFSDGQWGIVSQLFGSRRRGSKLGQPNQYFRLLDVHTRGEAILQLTRVAEAGYVPSLDLFVTLHTDRLEVVPLDLDLIFEQPELRPRVTGLMRCAMQITEDRAERRMHLDTARAHARGRLLEALQIEIADHRSPFRAYWQAD